MRRRARVDANHADIVATLRACGWYVHDTSRLGGGFPDLVCARAGKVILVEVKDGTKPLSKQILTQTEVEVHDRFTVRGVFVRIITSTKQAMSL